jgi:CRP/FNR family transcriptional regulator, cyclic AMP receptor protein
MGPDVPPSNAAINPSTLRMLERVPIFSSLSERQLRKLASDFVERNIPEGATIVKQGEKGVGFFLILDGRVEVRRMERRLATLGPGQFFGEMALVGNEPRTADVVAVQPSRCLVLSQWEFWGFASDQPKLLRGIIEEMARRLSASNQALSE